jgi:SNF2 family DNA or RNA helicase
MSGLAPAAEAFGLSWPAPLFAFQLAGAERMASSDALLLADEMGLGKTIQTIAALRILHARGELRQALVVMPTGLVLQWRRQFRAWAPELRLSTVVGKADDRRWAWAAPAAVYLASYEALRADIHGRATTAPGNREWDAVVADEAQRFKNPASELARAMRRLRRRRSFALTGTPLENRLDDLISILDFVVPGRFDPRHQAVGLRRLLAEVQLRRRRREVLSDLPPKFVDTTRLDLTADQHATYDRAEQEGLIRLAALGRDIRVTHVFELILRLKQICNFCPESGRSAKLEHLEDRIEAVAAAGEKALIFSQFAEETFGARRIAMALRRFDPLLLTGANDAQERVDIIAAFQRDRQRPLLVLSLRAGGVGLDLTAASHVFHFDRWWNPAVEAQAEDRAHRIGQERAVHVAAYLTQGTIEERIDEVIAEKRALFADVIDGVDASMLRRLDLDTLLAALQRER